MSSAPRNYEKKRIGTTIQLSSAREAEKRLRYGSVDRELAES
jgi:hypothetical protein